MTEDEMADGITNSMDMGLICQFTDCWPPVLEPPFCIGEPIK